MRDQSNYEIDHANAMVHAAANRKEAALPPRVTGRFGVRWYVYLALLLLAVAPYVFVFYGAGAVVVMGIIGVFGGVFLSATFFKEVANQPIQKS